MHPKTAAGTDKDGKMSKVKIALKKADRTRQKTEATTDQKETRHTIKRMTKTTMPAQNIRCEMISTSQQECPGILEQI